MKHRSFQKELMDLGPAYYTCDEYEECLIQLDRVGRFLGGDRATYKAFDQLKSLPTSILDVGCGGGQFTSRLAQRFSSAKVVGLDISEEAVQFAKKQTLPTNIEFHLSSQPELDYPVNSFDVVTCTLVCHHLNQEELISFLQSAMRIAKKAVIINDLHRHPLAFIGIKILSPLLFPNRLVQHDGPLSVKRAFNKKEWIHYLQQAGIQENKYSITWHWAFRWIVRIDVSDEI